ncbi:oxygenase MpaB family protein [Flavobacterium suzhouense]|uniref:Oxygenase MpaB family protein n=1 Tax=Flavobacterium suzhouense TaxID=1529638 RepID=A0ABW5NZB3_9FLAO
MEYFVDKDSIVRKIWGNSDTILFIFAGAAAEFALNKAVDWLYFTGKLPSDPLGRLFSTVSYARTIVFAEHDAALRSIDKIAAIHKGVEQGRGFKIPDWAYRDVLFMLIDYSIRSYELLERKLSEDEKQEVFNVFYRVGSRMGLQSLPKDFREWEISRQEHLQKDMVHSVHTTDLFRQYRKHLGDFRYRIMLESQLLVVPDKVRYMLSMRRFSILAPLIAGYKISKSMNLDNLIKSVLIPNKYKKEIDALNIIPT